jgi:hypothetical protein
MPAVEITISGVLYDKVNRTVQPVVLIGEASLTGLGVGGGPIVPPGGQPGGPVHIWGGGNVPMPSPPIANVPGLPPMPDEPPANPEEPKPPPPDGGWGWHPDYGWGYFPMTGGKPQPGPPDQPPEAQPAGRRHR